MKLTLAYYNYGSNTVDLVQIPKVIRKITQEQLEEVADLTRNRKLADRDVAFMGALKVNQYGYVIWADFPSEEPIHDLSEVFVQK